MWVGFFNVPFSVVVTRIVDMLDIVSVAVGYLMSVQFSSILRAVVAVVHVAVQLTTVQSCRHHKASVCPSSRAA